MNGKSVFDMTEKTNSLDGAPSVEKDCIQESVSRPNGVANSAICTLLSMLIDAGNGPTIYEVENELFNPRERAEINLSVTYARDFSHGTAGHNRLMLIAKLWQLVECMCNDMSKTPSGISKKEMMVKAIDLWNRDDTYLSPDEQEKRMVMVAQGIEGLDHYESDHILGSIGTPTDYSDKIIRLLLAEMHRLKYGNIS